MIQLYCHQFTRQLSTEQWQAYCKLLPLTTLEKISRYHHWQDRHAALFGRLLLKLALSEAGYPDNCLESIQFDSYKRPFIDSAIDFNISHSNEYVLCAITKNGRIGIDVEHIRAIDINDFKDFMTADEWHDIHQADEPIRRFYHYWTLKESVMKADGRGLYIPPHDIISYANHAVIGDKHWGLTQIPLADNHYCSHLAFEHDAPFSCFSISQKTISYDFAGMNLQPISIFEIFTRSHAPRGNAVSTRRVEQTAARSV